MSDNKTVANDGNVDEYIGSLNDPQQVEDSKQLVALFQKVTGEQPVMWGGSIIGFGKVSLTYTSGREVDWLQVGLAHAKGKISLYVTFDAAELTSQFPDLEGKYKIAKGCIYIIKLADVDMNELEKLIRTAYDAGYQSPKRSDGKEQIA